MPLLSPASITPSADAVASHVRSRTRDVNGVEAGTFNADTRPTGTEVDAIAARAARYVSLSVGTTGTEWAGDLTAAATDVAALYAALDVEQSYYADGTGGEEGAVDQLGRMVREQMAALVATARDNQPGGWRIRSIKQTVDPDLLADDAS